MSKDEVFNPFASPKSTPVEIESRSEEELTGPPWENEGSLVQRFTDTVTAVLFHPTETFRTARRLGRMEDARNYMMIGYTIGIFFVYLYQMVGMLLLSGAKPEQLGVAFGAVICGTIFAPIGAVIGLYLGGAMLHVGLIVIGGAKMPMETTFRAFAYMQGSIMMWSIIPVLGMILSIQGLYVGTVALSEMHGISRIRAFFGLFMPGILMLGIVLGVVMLIAGVAAATGVGK